MPTNTIALNSRKSAEELMSSGSSGLIMSVASFIGIVLIAPSNLYSVSFPYLIIGFDNDNVTSTKSPG